MNSGARPYGPDDGTISPWVVNASLPFAPEIVLPTIRHFLSLQIHAADGDDLGFKATFNATFQASDQEFDVESEQIDGNDIWVLPWYYGINQGMMIPMMENYRTGLIWQLMRQSPYLVNGLRRAGFDGGWLAEE